MEKGDGRLFGTRTIIRERYQYGWTAMTFWEKMGMGVSCLIQQRGF